MAIARRTGFAAPLVLVMAGCGSKPASDPPRTAAPADAAAVATAPIDAAAPAVDAPPAVARRQWSIGRRAADCFATDDPCSRMVRPPGSPIPPCNPPAPIAIACPPKDVIAIAERPDGTCETVSAVDCAPGQPCPQPAATTIACPRY